MSSEGRGAPPSEPPREELKRERDEFIKTFFRKGVELTEELVREREATRQRVAELESENAHLRAQLASEEAMRELLRKIEDLERDKELLLRRTHEVEAQSTQQAATFTEVEQELHNLANLYVASYQLHSSVSPRGVVQHIKELLAQFVGVQSFALYLVDEGETHLVPLISEGVARDELFPVPVGKGPIGEAFTTGVMSVTPGDARRGRLDAPAACIPLRVHDKQRGVIAVFNTLEQKPQFVHVDQELFKLLGSQAMTALVAARLFTDRGREVPPLASFRDLGV